MIKLTDNQIDVIWEGLGGSSQFMKTFGYQQFARAVLNETDRIRRMAALQEMIDLTQEQGLYD